MSFSPTVSHLHSSTSHRSTPHSSTPHRQYARPNHRLRRNTLSTQVLPVPIQSQAFKRHETISFVHYSLWRIHSGYVRTLTWSPEGDCVPLGFWGAGDVISHSAAQASPYSAECLTAVEAECLNVSQPLPRDTILNQIRQSNSLLRIVHCRDSERRILQFLCWLAEHFGSVRSEGIQVLLRLTHQEIAESVGTTRVTVSRLLKSLERKGYITWKTNQKMVFQETFNQFHLNAHSSNDLTDLRL